jgi:hypothetical protein
MTKQERNSQQSAAIEYRIQEYKNPKDQDRAAERAELLKRNKNFLKELQSACGKPYCADMTRLSRRWHIYEGWDGKLDELKLYVLRPPWLIFRGELHGRYSIMELYPDSPITKIFLGGAYPDVVVHKNRSVDPIVSIKGNFLLIKVDRQTELSDIEKINEKMD